MQFSSTKTGLLASVATTIALMSAATPAHSSDKVVVNDNSIEQHDWSGPYLGVLFGLGGLNSDGDHQFTTSSQIDLGTIDDVGFIGGGHIGWNFVEDHVLFGFEGDYSFGNMDDVAFSSDEVPPTSEFITYETDYFASLRARLGVIDNDVLFYATAGAAFTGGELFYTGDGPDVRRDVSFSGTVVGTGMEWAVSDSTRIRTEWLYTSFNGKDRLTDLASTQTEDFFLVDDILTFRAGVTWNFDGAPSFDSSEDETPHDWSGLFAGLHTGSGMLDTSGFFDTGDSSSMIDLGALSDAGILGGGTIGWNFQQGNVVVGVQADISVIDWDGAAREADSRTDVLQLDTDYVATLRGRLGYADGDLLVYGTAGVAFIEGTLIDPTGTSAGQNVGFDETGAVYGAGMEWAATENLSVVVEGLFLDFHDSTDLSDIGGGDAGDAFTLEDSLIAKVGINWSFN